MFCDAALNEFLLLKVLEFGDDWPESLAFHSLPTQGVNTLKSDVLVMFALKLFLVSGSSSACSGSPEMTTFSEPEDP